jgi:hypothetical protein
MPHRLRRDANCFFLLPGGSWGDRLGELRVRAGSPFVSSLPIRT